MADDSNKAPGDEVAPGTPQAGEHVCRCCKGTGKVNDAPCPDCRGTGKVTVLVGDA
jgi:DnaJ-class molecular chaperone